MFKQGQKVEYCPLDNMLPEDNCIEPPKGTMLTINYRNEDPKFWHVVEYPHTKDGSAQSFHYKVLRPLEDWENQDISELTEVLKNPCLIINH